MGVKRLKIADVAKDTGINRGTITRMYHEQSLRVELDIIEKLCFYLQVDLAELYELIKDKNH